MDAKAFIDSFHFSRQDIVQILNIFNKVPGIYYFYGNNADDFFYYVVAPMIHSYRLSSPDEEYEYERLKYKYYHLFYTFNDEMSMDYVEELAKTKPVIIITTIFNDSCIVFNIGAGELFSSTEYYRNFTNLFAPRCLDYLKEKMHPVVKVLR